MEKDCCTFEVADVTVSERPFPISPARQAIFDLLTRDYSTSTILSWEFPSWAAIGKLQTTPSEPHGIEACSHEERVLMKGASFHPVVFAAHACFCCHCPLTLSPDMIWLMIVQGVAEHVNANAERLRPQFVQHQGRVLLEVRRDDLMRGLPNQPWPEVIAEFVAKIRGHIGEQTSDLFIPCFSTTGADEKTACQVVLMYSLGQYFEYDLRTVCGIPRIELEGRPEDWRLLVERASTFRRFDLGWWIDPLDVVLKQFALASEGKVNRAFWNSLYHMHSGSIGAAYSGWLGVFFPYLRDKSGNTTKSHLLSSLAAYLSGIDRGYEASQDPEIDLPPPRMLPKGLTAAPFEWKYLSESIPMEFLGGFVGVVQDEETLALRPEIGWAVRDKPDYTRPHLTEDLSGRPAGTSERRAPVLAVSCWRCRHPLPVTDENRGKAVTCPSCGTKQKMPR